MSRLKTQETYLKYKQAFCRLHHVSDLCRLLKTDKRKLLLMAKRPRYKSFSVPKRDGGERHIDTPSPQLKKLQTQLNRYLQAVYFFEKSSAAYGFILGVRNDQDRRNVVTNAKKHLGRPYMLNIDLKDFFHAVQQSKIVELFEGPPFTFTGDLPDILARLTTFNGRLPMGAPTSPVLSNFACQSLDVKLVRMAKEKRWMYTRFADDMSFSAHRAFPQDDKKAINDLIVAAGFKVNVKKVKLFGPNDDKIVTGLLLAKKVELAPGYLEQLQAEVDQLKQVMYVQNFQGELDSKWVDDFKLQVRGRLNFAGFVMGRRNETYVSLKEQFYTAINPPEAEFGAVSWRSFPYKF